MSTVGMLMSRAMHPSNVARPRQPVEGTAVVAVDATLALVTGEPPLSPDATEDVLLALAALLAPRDDTVSQTLAHALADAGADRPHDPRRVTDGLLDLRNHISATR